MFLAFFAICGGVLLVLTCLLIQTFPEPVKIFQKEKNCEKSLDIISSVLYNNGKKPSCL